MSLRVPASSLPRVWVTAQVQDSEHRNQVGFRGEEHTVREITHQGPPNVLLDDGNLKRILQESGEDGIDLRLKAEAETRTLALVSKRRLEDLELGLSRNVEPPHLPNSAEASQQLLADLRPGAGGHLAAPVCPKALGNDLAMPVRDRDVLWMLGEMVPERLNVFELLVGRELVETRRRKRRLRHGPSISSSGALADPPHTTTANWRQERGGAIALPSRVAARASAFLSHVEPVIAGQPGDLQTLCICCRIVRGSSLSDEEAMMVLAEWNARCEAPWPEHELRQKVANARKYGREPQGGLR